MASSDELTPIQDVWMRLSGLITAVGMVDAAIHSDLPRYAPALQGWYDKIKEIAEFCDRQVNEVQEFGSAFDEEEEEDD